MHADSSEENRRELNMPTAKEIIMNTPAAELKEMHGRKMPAFLLPVAAYAMVNFPAAVTLGGGLMAWEMMTPPGHNFSPSGIGGAGITWLMERQNGATRKAQAGGR